MVQIPRWQIVLVIAVLLLGLIYAAPNLVERERLEGVPDWLPNQQVNLGLDLRGGSYILLEADLAEVLKEQLENLADSLRDTLRQNNIGYTDLRVEGEAVKFQVRDPGLLDRAKELAQVIAFDLFISDSNGAISVTYSEQFKTQLRQRILSQSVEIVRRRIDETGTREPSIQRQGDDRIVVQLPGIDDPERIKQLLGKTAKLTFRFVDEGVRPGIDRIPAGSELLPSDEFDAAGNPVRFAVRKRIMVSGDTLVDAQPTFRDGQPVVSFRFDSVGAKRFGDATSQNVGRLFAIVLDDKVISAPVIREPILGGQGEISGSFTVQEANDLALLLRAGALPAPLEVIEERTVGPGLGADSIRAGEIASVLGLLLVAVFMGVAYGLFGIMANVALLANLILLLASLSVLGATLTLPGIAGIALTIGMAVDANVLIFERIREEIANGRGPVSAIDAGYRRAIGTILDSNLTTLIAAILLFSFGTGPIKGFAVTLSIGLVTSMFTAIMLTRLLVVSWLRRRRPQSLPI